MIRTLDLGEDKSIEHEERQAREHAAIAALALLDEVASEDWPVQDHIEQLRVHYGRRRQRYVDVEAHGHGMHERGSRGIPAFAARDPDS